MEKAQVSLGNPSIFALCAFGFSLLALGVELTIAKQAVGAALYGLLFAGVLEFIAGMILIVKNESYLGNIVTIFGGWLLGYYMLLTQGRALGIYNEIAAGTYILCLLPPIVFLAIPAFKWRKYVLIGAFVALFALVLTLGIGVILANHGWLYFAGAMAYVSMFFIFWLALKNVMELLHQN